MITRSVVFTFVLAISDFFALPATALADLSAHPDIFI